MRAMFSALLGSGLLCASLAAAEPCARPADLAAFNVAAVKSNLMVTALTCDQRDRYNDFVQRFRTELIVQERALTAYFSRAFGGRGQREHDDYITNLANSQSQSGIRQGTLFCQQNIGVFSEVLALAKGDLTAYAANKQLPQPIDIAVCRTPTRTAQANATRR